MKLCTKKHPANEPDAAPDICIEGGGDRPYSKEDTFWMWSEHEDDLFCRTVNLTQDTWADHAINDAHKLASGYELEYSPEIAQFMIRNL